MLMLEKHKQYIATTTNHCSISLKKKKANEKEQLNLPAHRHSVIRI